MSPTSLEVVRNDFDRIAGLSAHAPERPDRYERFLLALIPDASRSILEVGCGAGRLTRALAARGAAVTAIDASPEMIRLARARAQGDTRVRFVCGDFLDGIAAPDTYDCVVSVATLHHLPAAAALARMVTCIRPGGTLVLHDLRRLSGPMDWLSSGLAAFASGDAYWWLRTRAGESPALRAAWRAHGKNERYLAMSEVNALYRSLLPGARLYQHPLWRYTAVWRKPQRAAPGSPVRP